MSTLTASPRPASSSPSSPFDPAQRSTPVEDSTSQRSRPTRLSAFLLTLLRALGAPSV